MRLILLGLTCIMLAACAPVYTPAPASGDVLPVEAGRIVDAATATAARMATQNAQATATSQTARESATAAALGTLGALAGQQTEVALSLTQGAGQAAATDASAGRTQAARLTAAWATPTAQAIKTQAAAAAVEQTRQQAAAANVGEFWKSLRFIVLALLIVGGLTVIVVVAFDRLTAVRIVRMREVAAIAQAAFRILPPAHYAEWHEGRYEVLQLPGAIDAPVTIIENAQPAHNDAFDWRQSVRLFCWWGDMHGFSLASLGPAGAGVVTDPTWRTLSRMLKDAGVLADVTLPGQKGRTTGWADGWTYRRLHDELSSGRLALPFPTDEPAPKVAYAVPNMTPQHA